MSENTPHRNTETPARVALVTGGGRGLGRCTAQTLAAQGFAVGLLDINPSDLEATAETIRRSGGKALPVLADVTDEAAVKDAVATVTRSLGDIDLLVNNAGLLARVGPMWQADPSEWRRVVDVNLFGTFLVSRFVLPDMIQRRRGRIVNLGSALTITSHMKLTDYRSSKAAVMYLTSALAAEVAEYGVKVFCVIPGAVRSAMTDVILRDLPGWNPGWMPMEQVAALIGFLANGKGDALSGRCIPVPKDLAELESQIDDIVQHDRYVVQFRK